MQGRYENSIFFIETERIYPNPYQPRREFDEHALNELADSIRQYGVLQPLVVSRVEKETGEGGLVTEYELIAGERRLRASRLAGLTQVPCVIRVGDDSMMKLELAIIENLQREDLNPVDRARAFLRLQEEFKFTHTQIGQKVGKSREYVSNTMRLLAMPQEILDALSQGKITEGHTRPLLMLSSRPEEQMVLFKEIMYKRISVREAEKIARGIAVEKIRRKEYIPDPEITELEHKLQESLGTRVHIEKKAEGGKIEISFFSGDDLRSILELLESNQKRKPYEMLENFEAKKSENAVSSPEENMEIQNTETDHQIDEISTEMLDDRSKEEEKKSEEDTDLYNISKFSI